MEVPHLLGMAAVPHQYRMISLQPFGVALLYAGYDPHHKSQFTTAALRETTVLFRPTRLVIVIGGSARRVLARCHRSSGGPPPAPTRCHQFFAVILDK
jgi:hypothetical protein